MITALALAIALRPAATGLTGGSFHCVATHESYQKPTDTLDFEGIRYGTCCASCASSFLKDPKKMIAADQKLGKLFGESLFDVVSGARITETGANAHADYKGIRYLFTSKEEAKMFEKNPAAYTVAPKKELVHCPVFDRDIANIASAAGYVDFKGVRYYVCCHSCLNAMHHDAAKYVAKFASQVTAAKADKNAQISGAG